MDRVAVGIGGNSKKADLGRLGADVGAVGNQPGLLGGPRLFKHKNRL